MKASIIKLDTGETQKVFGGQSQDGVCQAPCYMTKTDTTNVVFATAMVVVSEFAIIAIGYFAGKYFQKLKTN